MLTRPATTADAAEFVRLKAEIMTRHYPFDVDLDSEPGWSERAAEVFRGLVGRPDYAQFVVDDADRPGRLLGTISVHLERHLPGPGWPGLQTYIGDMCVDEHARGQGLGRLLFERARDWSREQGAGSMWLHATPGAEGMYEKFGFEPREYPELFRTMRMRIS